MIKVTGSFDPIVRTTKFDFIHFLTSQMICLVMQKKQTSIANMLELHVLHAKPLQYIYLYVQTSFFVIHYFSRKHSAKTLHSSLSLGVSFWAHT